ncbi:MAG: hypothetical protein ACREF3_11745, partial [Acetobacteraceae bacterium]
MKMRFIDAQYQRARADVQGPDLASPARTPHTPPRGSGEVQEEAMPLTEPAAIVFDTFGSVVDWRSSLIAELTEFGRRRGINGDWTGLVDAWRAAYHPSLNRVRSGEVPWTNLDALHRESLDRLVREFRITRLSEADLRHINLGWHRLNPWPDSVPGLMRLKRRFIIGPLSNGNVA